MNVDRLAVQDLLAEYGGLLDQGRYDDWLGLFAAECALYPAVIRAFAEGRIQQTGRRVTIASGTPACRPASGEE